MSNTTAVMERGIGSGGRPARAPLIVVPADHDLTVILPAYNEEKRLPWTLSELIEFLEDWGIDYRVLVADDGSTDRTSTLTAPPGAAMLDAPHLPRAARAAPCGPPCSVPRAECSASPMPISPSDLLPCDRATSG